MIFITRCFNKFISNCFIWFARIVTGVYPSFASENNDEQCIYFANHASHGDLIVIMAALPSYMRQDVCAAAAADYWNTGKIRSYLAKHVLHVISVERKKINRQNNPIDALGSVLEEGKSLIIFPEGTRNTTQETLLEFRSGLYKLANRYPNIKLVPCWIDNMTRILPKGALIPIPLLCRVQFGLPVYLNENETKSEFLTRMQVELLKLSPVKIVDIKNGAIDNE